MELQLREKEIFQILKKIRNFKFVVIGGYAINAYTLPRFSVDCDIVVENILNAKKIGKELGKYGYKKRFVDNYEGKFIRFEKDIDNFKVSLDILVGEVLDRQTNVIFTSKWIFKNSTLRMLKGKTITEELKLRIINPDALIIMKFISCRNPDIRDVFMLLPLAEDIKTVKDEISKRYDFKDRFQKIKEKISSKDFKNNLQGVFGYVDEKLFEKHKTALLEMG